MDSSSPTQSQVLGESRHASQIWAICLLFRSTSFKQSGEEAMCCICLKKVEDSAAPSVLWMLALALYTFGVNKIPQRGLFLCITLHYCTYEQWTIDCKIWFTDKLTDLGPCLCIFGFEHELGNIDEMLTQITNRLCFSLTHCKLLITGWELSSGHLSCKQMQQPSPKTEILPMSPWFYPCCW